MAFKDLHTISEIFGEYSSHETFDLSKIVKPAGKMQRYLEMVVHDKMLRGIETQAMRRHKNRLKRAARVEGLVRGQH